MPALLNLQLQARHFLKPGSIATVHASRAQSARALASRRPLKREFLGYLIPPFPTKNQREEAQKWPLGRLQILQ